MASRSAIRPPGTSRPWRRPRPDGGRPATGRHRPQGGRPIRLAADDKRPEPAYLALPVRSSQPRQGAPHPDAHHRRRHRPTHPGPDVPPRAAQRPAHGSGGPSRALGRLGLLSPRLHLRLPDRARRAGRPHPRLHGRGRRRHGRLDGQLVLAPALVRGHPMLAGVLYPVLADTAHELARAFGVLEPDGTCRRGTFVIDPEGIVRHAMISDGSVGRSAAETRAYPRAAHRRAVPGELAARPAVPARGLRGGPQCPGRRSRPGHRGNAGELTLDSARRRRPA